MMSKQDSRKARQKPSDACVDALRMLGRRELSEAQVRQRLERRGYDSRAIDAAVGRLTEERAIDDRRVAETIARRSAGVKRRGPLRVKRELESAGIADTTARMALDEAFAELDEEALLEAALDRRLRGRRDIADDTEFARLYRYLLGQGFDVNRIIGALTRRRSGSGS